MKRVELEDFLDLQEIKQQKEALARTTEAMAPWTFGIGPCKLEEPRSELPSKVQQKGNGSLSKAPHPHSTTN